MKSFKKHITKTLIRIAEILNVRTNLTAKIVEDAIDNMIKRHWEESQSGRKFPITEMKFPKELAHCLLFTFSKEELDKIEYIKYETSFGIVKLLLV